MVQCICTTLKGIRCKKPAGKTSKFCSTHSKKCASKSLRDFSPKVSKSPGTKVIAPPKIVVTPKSKKSKKKVISWKDKALALGIVQGWDFKGQVPFETAEETFVIRATEQGTGRQGILKLGTWISTLVSEEAVYLQMLANRAIKLGLKPKQFPFPQIIDKAQGFVDQKNGWRGFVMDILGNSLEKETIPLKPKEVKMIAKSLILAQQIAHSSSWYGKDGAIHNDIFAGNVLHGGPNRDKNVFCLTDWQLGTSKTPRGKIMNVIAGHPEFQGLEAIESYHPSVKTDLEGLGQFLFYLTTDSLLWGKREYIIQNTKDMKDLAKLKRAWRKDFEKRIKSSKMSVELQKSFAVFFRTVYSMKSENVNVDYAMLIKQFN